MALSRGRPSRDATLETLAPSHQRTKVRMSSLQNLLLFLGAMPGSSRIRFRSLASLCAVPPLGWAPRGRRKSHAFAHAYIMARHEGHTMLQFKKKLWHRRMLHKYKHYLVILHKTTWLAKSRQHK
jgi:hypothetical protein